jgi:hypothetical protein
MRTCQRPHIDMLELPANCHAALPLIVRRLDLAQQAAVAAVRRAYRATFGQSIQTAFFAGGGAPSRMPLGSMSRFRPDDAR